MFHLRTDLANSAKADKNYCIPHLFLLQWLLVRKDDNEAGSPSEWNITGTYKGLLILLTLFAFIAIRNLISQRISFLKDS